MDNDKYNDGYINPYKFDYKSYIKEMYNLEEMPSRHDLGPLGYDDYAINLNHGVEIEKNEKYIGIYKDGDNLEYRLYYEKLNDSNIYYLLTKDDPVVIMIYSFIRVNKPIKGIDNKEIWNHIRFKGTARRFLENYILKKEPVMISDANLSITGYKMWKSLFRNNVINNKTHKMFVMNYASGETLKNIENEDEMDEFFGSTMLGVRFVLEKL